jgi:hypothetical protein
MLGQRRLADTRLPDQVHHPRRPPPRRRHCGRDRRQLPRARPTSTPADPCSPTPGTLPDGSATVPPSPSTVGCQPGRMSASPGDDTESPDDLSNRLRAGFDVARHGARVGMLSRGHERPELPGNRCRSRRDHGSRSADKGEQRCPVQCVAAVSLHSAGTARTCDARPCRCERGPPSR